MDLLPDSIGPAEGDAWTVEHILALRRLQFFNDLRFVVRRPSHGVVHLDGEPAVLVGEVLALARIAITARQLADADPQRPAGDVLREARATVLRDVRREHGRFMDGHDPC